MGFLMEGAINGVSVGIGEGVVGRVSENVGLEPVNDGKTVGLEPVNGGKTVGLEPVSGKTEVGGMIEVVFTLAGETFYHNGR